LVAIDAPRERDPVKNAVKQLSRWLAVPTAVLATLGVHGAAAVIVLAVLVAWIIGSDVRVARLTSIISACRGEARSPAASAATMPIDCVMPAPPHASVSRVENVPVTSSDAHVTG
jgi:hypothetical protein